MRNIILLTGPAGSGKSAVARFLCSYYGRFQLVKFAGPLKDMMRAVGLTDLEIEGNFKQEPCSDLCFKTPRYAMQTLGTEWGRNLIGADFWTNLWKRRVRALPPYADVVTDDCRFPNEAAAAREVGNPVVVRLQRDGAGAKGGVQGHESEQTLPWDYLVHNNGSLLDAAKKIHRISVEA